MDAGHICQNLYLATSAVDCGVCAIDAFDYNKIHEFLEIDGVDEILVYLLLLVKNNNYPNSRFSIQWS